MRSAIKEILGPYNEKFYDRFDIYRHVIGGVFGFSYCARKHPRIVMELHVGAGQAVHRRITRRALEHPEISDHTQLADETSKFSMRFGLCLGYVFF